MFSTNGLHYNEFRFICDTEDDIKDLPTKNNKVKGYTEPAPGARAFVIDGPYGYMYGNDCEWHKIF